MHKYYNTQKLDQLREQVHRDQLQQQQQLSNLERGGINNSGNNNSNSNSGNPLNNSSGSIGKQNKFVYTGGGFSTSNSNRDREQLQLQKQQQLQQQQDPLNYTNSNNDHQQYSSSSIGNNSMNMNSGSNSSYKSNILEDNSHTLLYQSTLSGPMMPMVKKPAKYKISYTVGENGGDGKHMFGVNSLTLDRSNDILYTGGRDSTIKSWKVNQDTNSVEFVNSFNDHTDWVNDIFICKDNQILVSASSDTTIKIWNVAEGGSCVKTLKKPHTDYVKVLAYSPLTNCFASAGLDSQIILWDLNECAMISNLNNSSQRCDGNNGNGMNSSGSKTHYNPKQHIIGSLNSSSGFLSTSYHKSLMSSSPSNLSNNQNQNQNLVVGNNNNSNEDGDEDDQLGNSSDRVINNNNQNSNIYDKPMPLYENNKMIVGRAGSDNLSIYSLAMNDQATLVLAGSTSRTIHGWDVRGGLMAFKLKGHTDNVRSLCMSGDGKLAVSASSDGTIRLWDVGTRKCIHCFDEVHQDSVWKVATDPFFNYILSGGRDGLVCRTDLKTYNSSIIFKENNPILDLLESNDSRVWVSTTDSIVKNWSLSNQNQNQNNSNTLLVNNLEKEIRFIDEEIDNQNNNNSHNNNIEKPLIVIPGSAGIVKHHIMNNRREILTQDTDGVIKLWDITKGGQVMQFGKENKDFDKLIEELQEIISVPKWMSVDTKTGSINVTLEAPICFQADVNLTNLGVKLLEGEDDGIYNIGERVIVSLFSFWFNRITSKVSSEKDELDQSIDNDNNNQSSPVLNGNSNHNSNNNVNNSNANGNDNESDIHSETNSISSNNNINGGEKKRNLKSNQSSSTTTPNSLTPNTSYSSIDKLSLSSNNNYHHHNNNHNSNNNNNNNSQQQHKRMIFELPNSTTIVITQDGTTLHRSRIDQFTGRESEIIPPWVKSCVLNGVYKNEPSKESKIIFALSPHEDKNISALPKQTKLEAFGSVLMRKVCSHILNGLGTADPTTPSDEYLELFCNGKLLLPTYSLMTVKSFFWKSSEDVQLTYRVKRQYVNETELRKLIKSKKSSQSSSSSSSLSSSKQNNHSNNTNNNNNNNVPPKSTSSSPSSHASMYYSTVNK